MINPISTATHLTAEQIQAMQKELYELRAMKATLSAKYDSIKSTLHEVSDQLNYLVLTIPDGLSTSMMPSQADGLSIILRHIKNDVEDVQEGVRELFE